MYEKLNSLLTMIIEKQRNATLLFLKLKINYFWLDTENSIVYPGCCTKYTMQWTRGVYTR